MEISILRQILEGGLDKMNEAGVVLPGGHSIEDKELKYGISITGFVRPDHVIQNTGLKPGGAFKNKEFRAGMVTFSDSIDPIMQDILFDPQTSGGLLIGVQDTLARDLLEELKAKGVAHATVIGKVTDRPAGRIIVE